jgi:hypothetical protein
MKRSDLEHIIRAACTIADDNDLVIIGSQSILGQYPNAPEALTVSNEADVYPRNHPERWELIDGSIGELSPFHETFGYYAQGVEPGTAILPFGWEPRLVGISGPATNHATGWCLEMHDLLVSKYVACRDKDRRFVQSAILCGFADESILRTRLDQTELTPLSRQRLIELIQYDFAWAARLEHKS